MEKETFLLDETWKNIEMNHLTFPKSFDENHFHVLRTPRLYFVLSIRKKNNKLRMRSLLRGDMNRSKPYKVTLLGASSKVPLLIEIWESVGDPWKINADFRINGFHLDELYKDVFEYDDDSRSNGLTKHFDTFEEAQIFLDKWKEKIIIDHQIQLLEDKQFVQSLQ